MKGKIITFSNFILILVVFATIFTSCKKDTIVPDTEIDYSYVNHTIGNWIEYDVTEITIDKASDVYDTTHYYIKEIVTEKFIDLSDNESNRIERFIRYNTNSNWIIKDVWSAQIVENSYQKVEEDVRFKRLVFPSDSGKTWNGNIFNTLDEQNYVITSVDEYEIVNSLAFDSVLTVTQANELNLIEKNYAIEKFAKNIGLIYKENCYIYSNEVDPGKPIEQRATLANILIMKVISYGSN